MSILFVPFEFLSIFLLIIEKYGLRLAKIERMDRQKAINMKKFLVSSIAGIMAVVVANAEVVELRTDNCDVASMRSELNRAVARHHAVITKIVCEKPVVVAEPVKAEPCGEPFARVVNREYFVRETVQQYEPVVRYEPDEAYTTFRAVCKGNDCGK